MSLLTKVAAIRNAALLSGASAVVSASDWSSVVTALTNQISVSTVIGVLSSIVSTGIGLVFMWWGVRKALKSLMGAFKHGYLGM